jgi:ABC-type oligopeptide transport system substrate-binding subunit
MRTFYGYSTVPVDPELYASHISADGTTTTYGTDYNTCYYTGGFYAFDWTKESLVSLKKNPNYVYADDVNFTEVYLHTVPDANTKALMFENGELDFITLDETTAEKYNESPYYVPEPSRYVLSIEFGDTSAYYERTAEGELVLHNLGTAEMNLPILADMNFKKAIFYAVNRTELANLVHLRPATGLIPDTSVAYDDGTRFCDTDVAKSYRLTPEEAYNPELAKQCFEQAMKDNGYGPNDKLTVELLINTITLQKMTGAYLQQQLPKVFGEDRFELTINELADTPRLAQMKNWRNDRNPYQIAFTNWSFSNADEMPIRALTCYSPSNYARTNSGTHCKEFEEIIYTLNTDERLFIDREYGCQKAGEAEKLALENYLAVPIIGRTTHYMVSDKIILPIDPELGLGFFDWLADLDVE